MQLVEFFLSKNLPFTKDEQQIAASWINNKTASATELTALERMVKKELPFTKTIFQSLVAVQETQSLHHQLEELRSNLENPSFDSLKTIQTLKERITSLTKNHSTDEIGAAKEVKQMLEKLVQSLGLNYENEVLSQANDKMVSRESLQSLKQLIMVAMTELGSNEKKVLEPLLNRLTGLQLISQDLSGTTQQIIMQLPFAYGEKKSDITIQWNGQKTSNGKIDPDYCRIVFCLDLQSLNQTVVDMQIQNRVIHLSVINDSNEIEPIVKALTPSLKEKLESIGYTLSFIQVNSSFEKRGSEILQQINPVNLSLDFYHKVDRKI